MKVSVANVAFDNVTMKEAVGKIVEMARKTDNSRYICTGNLDHLATLDRDPAFRTVYAEAALVLADGAPVLWLSKLFGGTPLTERVTGSDLFWELAAASAEYGISLFFVGGKPGAAESAAQAARERHPGVQICGTDCPSFTDFDTLEEQARIRAAICAAKPDILLVGLGAPKQEKWIHANRDLLGVPVSIGVGGTFEMAAGVVKRAPQWMQRVGMEWAYRFLQEPTRLWERYFGRDLPFLLSLVIRTAVRGRLHRVEPFVLEAAQMMVTTEPIPEVLCQVAPVLRATSGFHRQPLIPQSGGHRPKVTGRLGLRSKDR